MFRKLALTAAATLALGAAALAPTDASAHWHGGGWHGGGWHGGGGWHHGYYGPRFAFGGPVYGYGGGCWRVRRVWTPYGPRLRRVNVCY